MRWIRGAFKALLAIVLMLLIGLFLIVQFPGWILNDSSLLWLERGLRAFEVPVTWKQGHWQGSYVSFWKKALDFRFRSVCYTQPTPYTHACVHDLKGRIVVDLRKRQLWIQELRTTSGELKLENTQSVQSSAPSQGPTKISLLEPLHLLKTGWLKVVRWEHVEIRGFNALIVSGGAATRVQISVDSSSTDSTSRLLTHLRGHYAQKGTRISANAAISLEWPHQGPLNYQINAGWGYRHNQNTLVTKGHVHPTRLDGRITLDARAPAPQVRQARLENCEYHWQEEKNVSFRFRCTAEARIHHELGQRANWRRWLRRPVKASINLVGTLPDKELEKSQATLHVESGLPDAGLDLVADLHTDLAAERAFRLNTQLQLSRFNHLVAALASTPWAIPAPVNQLSGSLAIQGQGEADRRFRKIHSTFSAQTALASHPQRLFVKTDGSFTYVPEEKTNRADLKADIVLEDVLLSLPHLDLLGLPRLFPDARIVYPGEKPALKLSQNIRLRTRKGKPAVVQSTQFGVHIPVSLNLKLSDSMTGTIHVSRFPVHVLRRNIEVEGVEVRFPREGAAELAAQLDVHYNTYDVRLTADGRLDSPRYSIRSNPPLSENSAWSLLLFGKPLEELSPGQSESLANTRAAVTNGAVSALSMYLLASTPIESVGYDPSQKKFSASIRLLQGTSLQVAGGPTGASSVGIRKRLAPEWVLNTYVERNSSAEDHRSVGTYLEWNRSY